MGTHTHTQAGRHTHTHRDTQACNAGSMSGAGAEQRAWAHTRGLRACQVAWGSHAAGEECDLKCANIL